MPELPDILLYLHALRPRVVGKRLSGVRLVSAFLLRSIDPPIAKAVSLPICTESASALSSNWKANCSSYFTS